jgi:hypothetical protein
MLRRFFQRHLLPASAAVLLAVGITLSAREASAADAAPPAAAPFALIPIPGDPQPLALPPPPVASSPLAATPPAASYPAAVAKPAATAKPASIDPALLSAASQTIRSILIESVPPRIEESKNWGDTRERFSQLNVRLDSGKLKVKTDTTKVNHGLWKQLVVVPVEPQKNLQFRIVDARSVGPGAMEFEVVASSPLGITARVERWRTGLKLFNISTDADASIEMHIIGDVTHEHRTIDGKPYLVFNPVIRKVDLRLTEFDLRRVGPAGGQLVSDLGDMLSDPLADQLHRQEPKVAEKINAAIAKKQDKLRLPLSIPVDFSGWSWGGSTKKPETKTAAKPEASGGR